MTFSSAMIGGGLGFLCQMFSNWIQKVPISRQPWLHVGMFGLGAYVGHKLPLWERAMVESVNEDLRAQGLPPLVGTRAFFPENYAANFAPKPKEKEDS